MIKTTEYRMIFSNKELKLMTRIKVLNEALYNIFIGTKWDLESCQSVTATFTLSQQGDEFVCLVELEEDNE